MTQNNVQLQNGNGPLAGLRNQLINGNFAVQQRYTTSAAWQGLANGVYTADRWQTGGTLMDVAWVFGTDALPFRSRMTITNKSAGNNSGLSQLIELPSSEGYGPFSSGAQFVLSFWSNTALTASGSEVSVDIYDFSSSTFIASATMASIGAIEGPLAGYTRYAYSVTIPNYTYNANYAVRVNIFQGATAANTAFSFTGVQLEPGPIATPFESRPIGAEFALCRRYYQVQDGAFSAVATLKQAYGSIQLVPMRAVPTVTVRSRASGGQPNVNNAAFNVQLGSNYSPVSVSQYGSNFVAAISGSATFASGLNQFLAFSVLCDAEL